MHLLTTVSSLFALLALSGALPPFKGMSAPFCFLHPNYQFYPFQLGRITNQHSLDSDTAIIIR